MITTMPPGYSISATALAGRAYWEVRYVGRLVGIFATHQRALEVAVEHAS